MVVFRCPPYIQNQPGGSLALKGGAYACICHVYRILWLGGHPAWFYRLYRPRIWKKKGVVFRCPPYIQNQPGGSLALKGGAYACICHVYRILWLRGHPAWFYRLYTRVDLRTYHGGTFLARNRPLWQAPSGLWLSARLPVGVGRLSVGPGQAREPGGEAHLCV